MTSTDGEIDPLMDNNGEATVAPTSSQDNDESDGKRKKRRLFAWGSLRFNFPRRQTIERYFKKGRRVDAWCGLCQFCVEYFVYLLGPVLICLASAIISLLVYTYFTIIQEMLRLHYIDTSYGTYIIHAHTTMVLFLLVNVVTNYALCVMTSNIKGKSYDKVMREMATATGFHFPESPAAVDQFRKDYEDRMILRMQCRRQRAMDAANRQANALNEANNNSNTTNNNNNNNMTQRKNAGNGSVNTPAPVEPVMRPWMMMGPLEWGFCNRTNQPKPPRAHYCHVSKGLVFCLDHYCPWMFNSVGYFNYRYFVNFLLFGCFSMFYGASMTYAPFIMLSTHKYREQLHAVKQHLKVSNSPILPARLDPFLPYPHEKMYITLTFMLCLAVGMAVSMLCFFHVYLTLTSQTTIEFHGNYTNSRRAKRLGKKWKNPYDFGRLHNFQCIYGASYRPFLAICIPSAREPEFLPIPLPGDQGKRSTYATAGKQTSSKSREKGDFVV